MIEFPATDRALTTATAARRERALGTALTELALTISLIFSIAVILAVAGATVADAATRSDLIMMEESAGTTLTTIGIVSVIAVVMGVLTILALRDVAPAHSKRGQRRHTTTTASRR